MRHYSAWDIRKMLSRVHCKKPWEKITDVALAPFTYPTTGQSASDIMSGDPNPITGAPLIPGTGDQGGGGAAPPLPQQEEVTFEPVEFDPIAYSQKVAKANTPQLFKNITIGFAAGRKIAATNTAFNMDQFTKYLNTVMPGTTEMEAAVTRNITSDLNFILPPQLVQAGISSSAEQSMSAGIAGTESAAAVERYNLTTLASDRELQARQDALKLFDLTFRTTSSLLVDPTKLGEDLMTTFNNYTMLTPAQAAQMELNKLEFNASGETQASEFNSTVGFNNQLVAYNDYLYKQQLKTAEQNQKAGLFGAVGSLLGTGLGIALAPATGGASLLIPAAMGAAGGYLGSSLAGGNSMMTAGATVSGGSTGLGTAAAWQTVQANQNLTNSMTKYYNSATPSSPIAPTPTGGSNLGGSTPAAFSNPAIHF